LKDKICERETKIFDFGYDYFRNELNIKESSGSIRDINLIFWSLKIFKLYKKKKINEKELLTNNEKIKFQFLLEFYLLYQMLFTL
jgi:GlnD PII-uridylyltransferase.